MAAGHQEGGGKVATYLRTDAQDARTNTTDVSPTANGRAIPFEPSPQEIAVWWESLSPRGNKADTGTAIRRFRAYARRLESELLWLALGELAVEGLPAHYFTELIARERIARIREVMREAEKAEELVRPLKVRGRLHSIAAILRGAA